jgi:hypothetical protein
MIRQMSKKFGRNKPATIDEDEPSVTVVNNNEARTPMQEEGLREMAINDEDFADDDDGRGNLERTVRARDNTIISMDKKRLEKDTELAALQKELNEERLRQMEEAILHNLESERLKKQTEAMEERLEALERDMQDREASTMPTALVYHFYGSYLVYRLTISINRFAGNT